MYLLLFSSFNRHSVFGKFSVYSHGEFFYKSWMAIAVVASLLQVVRGGGYGNGRRQADNGSGGGSGRS